MGSRRGIRSPRQVATVIGAFFLAYGIYARWWAHDTHPLYAFASWGMGILWVVLALLSGEDNKPA